MVRSSEEAMKAAAAQTTNKPGTCQLTVRTWFDAPSAGDVDHDKDADAVDGWLSEPAHARHAGDRNPPAGKPLAFSGGSKGYGHRAMSWPGGKVRSTDMDGDAYRAGHTGFTTIEAIERHMGVHYLGWSETIDGQPIPADKPAPRPPAPKGPTRVAKARVLLTKALELAERNGKKQRAESISAALKALPKR